MAAAGSNDRRRIDCALRMNLRTNTNFDWSPITLGRPVRSLQLDGFIFTESAYSPFQVLRPHAHELATISLVRRGSFVEILRKRSQQCRRFSLVVEPPGEVHSDQFGPEGAVCFHLTFNPQRIEAIRPLSKILDDARHIRAASLAILTARIEQEVHLMDEASLLAIQSLVFELLAQTVRFGSKDSSTVPPLWLSRAKDFIHANFAADLRLQTIADCAGVHPCHLAKSFRKYYHLCVGDYLRQIRLDKAILLMSASRRSLAEIAASVGFYDQSHFTNAFRDRTGTTPAKFQIALRSGKAHTKISDPSKTC